MGPSNLNSGASISHALAAAATVLALLLPQGASAQDMRHPQHQPQNRLQGVPPSQFIPCPSIGEPLIRVPELRAQDGKLRGTIVLSTQATRMNLALGPTNCVPQFVRAFSGVNAVLPDYPGMIPPGFPNAGQPAPPSQYPDPVPGPTLRARVGDIVELTFLNQVDPGPFGDSIDRAEYGQGCDETSAPYPGLDKFPDCFHGSSTGNIHFHGTHANPTTTGDNIFVEVRPSLRKGGQPVVTEASVRPYFDEFFKNCETQLTQLDKSQLSQWPYTWDDLPSGWINSQIDLLRAYDSDPATKSKLLPVDEEQRKKGAWPQYYIGAYPYCFHLPVLATPPSPQTARPPTHPAAMMAMPADVGRTLQMGQAPGTHWYHAHKHGSTTINVSNGMTGVFVIEGASYDDVLDTFYGPGWTRTQPVLVVNQLGVSPTMMGGGNAGPLPFSVNGRFQPTITMKPGEVQMWRIANTSPRGGIFVLGFAPAATPDALAPPPFKWKQIAQDGVQFRGSNYQSSNSPNLVIAAANRADLLVQAPPNTSGQPQTYSLMVKQVRSYCETLQSSPLCDPQPATVLLNVQVSTTPAAGNQAQFIPPAQLDASFPPFLRDIGDDEVKATRRITFQSTATGGGQPKVMHMIDGKKFDGNIGQVVLLNAVEEWKIENTAVAQPDPPGLVDHPFHIHVNPFQIVEVFNPNQLVTTSNGTQIPKYVIGPVQDSALQCPLNPDDPATWKDCHNVPQTHRIWWDVFAIPSGMSATNAAGQQTVIPGYFRMRSRFVDFTGQYVMHCHILAHEDRGMMTVVEVVPFTTAYSHQ